jgi:hypothetical protein
MNVAPLPLLWQTFCRCLLPFFDRRHAWRIPALFLGILFARGRRTVASWLRAAAVGADFPAYYLALARLGRRHRLLASDVFHRAVAQTVPPGSSLLIALDDSPTQRYGPLVQGAGIHHNPTPGPADQRFLYGHVWVSTALLAEHPAWGTIGLPVRADLYIRQDDLPSVPSHYGWAFRTKLQIAAEQLHWVAAHRVTLGGRPVLAAMDGAYAKRPVLRQARQDGITVVSRLPRNAALCDVPVTPSGRRRPGRPRVYGAVRLSLRHRGTHPGGWRELRVEQYGAEEVKRVKTFLATWRPAGGLIRVVVVREESGWLAFFSTDPNLSAAEILRIASRRTAIEQTFADLKAVEGWGEQQLRDVWANVGASQANVCSHTLLELWAWERPHEELVDRRASPWDDPERRPSHADRRKALQRQALAQEFSRLCEGQEVGAEIQEFIGRLIERAA